VTLATGTRLGAYEILGPLGAGGMGEVWRARDSRLGRDVAIKVLPAHLSGDGAAAARFEREARAVAALSHPHIMAIHDVGTENGVAFAVMELLEGRSLRERLAAGPIPLRKAVEYAAQTAHGLAAAHEKGIVHRDLKPENLFVTTGGQVKILDFGLARQGPSSAQDDDSPTRARDTDPGTVLGTAGYMSPEQVRGAAVDHRSDIFSLGCVLYEMLTGRRAFRRDTAAETMTAILREEPPELAVSNTEAGPALDRIVRHCLEKAPSERFQSARDLAFDLEAVLQGSGRSAPVAAAAGPVPRRVSAGVALAVGAVAVTAAMAAGWASGRGRGAGTPTAPEPAFTRLSFGQGTIRAARFAPDGKTVIYGAAWQGRPIRIFLTRLESAESTPVILPDAELLSVSRSGELAVSIGHQFNGWMGSGTLARAPLLGGGARPVAEGIREADWSPDGSGLAVVRRVEGRERLEFPMGKVLVDTPGYVSHVRFSPDGKQIAFIDHPLWADDMGVVAVVDLAGRKRTLTGSWTSARGVAWSPSGQEVWFTATTGAQNASLRGVDLAGRQRLLLGGLTHMILLDVSREGRVLLGRETLVKHVEALMAGQARPMDVSIESEGPAGRFMSPDGTTLVLGDQFREGYQTYLRRSDGSPPVRLGEGDGYSLSPDGKWVLSLTPDAVPRILLHPTGPGQTREVPNPARVIASVARWLPGGRGIVVIGPTSTMASRGYVFDSEGGPAHPITPEGVEASTLDLGIPLSPDGSRFVARHETAGYNVYRVDGGAAQPIPGLADGDVPIQWSEDGRALFVGRRSGASWQIRRLDIATGQSKPWTEITPTQTAGLRLSAVYVTPNGRFWLHSYGRLLTDLYVAEGLR